MSTATLVIPTLNRADLLDVALQSIARLQPAVGIDVDVLVVDNGSSDDTANRVSSRQDTFPWPLRRVMEARTGLNHARNRAIVESASDWLVFLDDDMQIGSEWLHGLSTAITDLKADALTGPVNPCFVGESQPWVPASALDSVSSTYSQKGDRTFVLQIQRSQEVAGCNFGVRRLLARELGGFHADLDRAGTQMLAGGDTEFGLRLRARAARVVYDPRCSIVHEVSQSKISSQGLLRRWRGLGATARAIETLHGGRYYGLSPRRAPMLWIAAQLRSVLGRIQGRHADVFEQRLIAARAMGYLRDGPRDIKPILAPTLVNESLGPALELLVSVHPAGLVPDQPGEGPATV